MGVTPGLSGSVGGAQGPAHVASSQATLVLETTPGKQYSERHSSAASVAPLDWAVLSRFCQFTFMSTSDLRNRLCIACVY